MPSGYSVQNVEQPVRVLEGDLVAQNRIVEVRGSRLLALRDFAERPVVLRRMCTGSSNCATASSRRSNRRPQRTFGSSAAPEIALTTSKFKRFDRFSSFWPPRTQNLAEIVTPRLLAIGGGTGDKAGLPVPFQPKPAGRQP